MTVLARSSYWLVLGCCTGAALLSSCGDADTVLALNVKLRQSAVSARTLTVSVAQAGQSTLDTTVTIATKVTDAGTVLKSDAFFERITLPESFTESEASVTVIAKDATGAAVGTSVAKVAVLPAEAFAGFITVGEDPPPAAVAP